MTVISRLFRIRAEYVECGIRVPVYRYTTSSITFFTTSITDNLELSTLLIGHCTIH